MTNSELRNALAQHPDSWEVTIDDIDSSATFWLRDINDVSTTQRTTGILNPEPTVRTVIVLS